MIYFKSEKRNRFLCSLYLFMKISKSDINCKKKVSKKNSKGENKWKKEKRC